MDDIVVIYKSRYGTTQQYAEWISKELNADLLECSEVKPENLLPYNTIIFGGGLYASGIDGIKLITQNFNDLIKKNVVVFTVGLASTEDKKIFEPIIERNFTEEMNKKIQFFHLRGGIDYKKLSLIHKSMMWMLKNTVSKKNTSELSPDDKMMLDTYGQKIDFTDKKTIEPLVLYVTDCNQ